MKISKIKKLCKACGQKIELSPVLSAALKRLCEIADSISEEGAGNDGE